MDDIIREWGAVLDWSQISIGHLNSICEKVSQNLSQKR